jgi:pimeloyl-ACP methyl ester carboxylesterase
MPIASEGRRLSGSRLDDGAGGGVRWHRASFGPRRRDDFMAKLPQLPVLWIMAVGWAACGCAGSRCQVCSVPLSMPVGDVVVTVPGAGNYPTLSTSLRQALADERLPLTVEEFDWAHANGRILSDQTDYAYARMQGQRLADCILAYRQLCPNARIAIVAHSAGSAVVLAATESLPPDSVDRIILLAPAVSAGYDLRPALRCCRRGVDAYTSQRDVFYLGIGTSLIGTSDRRWTDAAGRAGFQPVIGACDDACSYAKFRQHPWDDCVAWTGNHGGHSDSLRAAYLRAYVVPLFRGE